MTRILALSDIHADWMRFCPSRLPQADIVLIAGDITESGSKSAAEVSQARDWLVDIASRYAFVGWIPGNHDVGITNETFGDLPNVRPILDRTLTVAPPGVSSSLSVHGVSCCPAYAMPSLMERFAYMTVEQDHENSFFQFGSVDCVVSHCPPYGFLDRWMASDDVQYHIGSRSLASYIQRHRPRLVICGHVHDECGYYISGNTHIYNVARSIRVIDWDMIID